jgi:hypothetical protein
MADALLPVKMAQSFKSKCGGGRRSGGEGRMQRGREREEEKERGKKRRREGRRELPAAVPYILGSY